jgi:hypothetical protein
VQLINFLDDKLLNALRGAMGAPLSRYMVRIELPQPLFKPKVPTTIVLPLPTEGLEVAGSEIKTHTDGTLIYKNKRVLVHIRDATHHIPRYHLTDCLTLVEMKTQGRFEKYVVSEGDEGIFFVRMGGGPLTKRPLPVCQNCLDKLNWNGFSRDSMPRSARHEIVRLFSVKEFFKKYPISLHPVLPTSTAETAPKNDYPENWSFIASELKRQLGYYCQQCRLVLGEAHKRFLHVHHVNGVKSDCRVENLKCLCLSCHAEQPMHEGMKQSSEYKDFKSVFP